MTIRLQGHVLMFEQKGARTLEMDPDHSDLFNLKQVACLNLRFVTNTQGKVVELAVIYPLSGPTARSNPDASAERHLFFARIIASFVRRQGDQ
jgi:hypothetical protein